MNDPREQIARYLESGDPRKVAHAHQRLALLETEPPRTQSPPKARSAKPRLSIADLARARRACVPCNARKEPWEDLGWLQRWANMGVNPDADFARYLNPPLSTPPDGPPIYGWLHVAVMGGWERIARELFSQIERSGLRAATSKVFVGVVGADVDLSWFPPWAEIVKRDGDLKIGENSTLEAMWAWSKSVGAGRAWYVHTKGASRGANANVKAWVDLLTYINVLKWRDCVEALGTYDMAGCDFVDADIGAAEWFKKLWGSPHLRGAGWPGNFWHARTEYLAGLPPDKVRLDRDRWDAEWDFAGTGNPRVKAFHEPRVNFYSTFYPRSRYDPSAALSPPP